MIIEGSQWFTVNYHYASQVLKDMTENYKTYLERSRKHIQHSKNFSLEKMSEKFVSIIDKIIEDIPQPVQLKLPKLKKVGSNGETEFQQKLNYLNLKKLMYEIRI